MKYGEQRGALGYAPNYTTAVLVMGFVNLFWIFIAIWAIWGMHVVVLVGLLLNWLISRLRPKPHRPKPLSQP